MRNFKIVTLTSRLRAGVLVTSFILATMSLFQNCHGPTLESRLSSKGGSMSPGTLVDELETGAQQNSSVGHSNDQSSGIHSPHQVDFKLYWPRPVAGQYLVKNFSQVSSTGTIPALYVRHGLHPSGVYTLEEFDPELKWLSTWNYVITSLGVLEVADQFPDPNDPNRHSSILFREEFPIQWGNVLTIGERKSSQIVKDAARMGTAPSPTDYGHQYLELKALHPSLTIGDQGFHNVAVLAVSQSWCLNDECSKKQVFNQIYSLAPEIGIVQIEYFSEDWSPLGRHFIDRWCYGSSTMLKCQ